MCHLLFYTGMCCSESANNTQKGKLETAWAKGASRSPTPLTICFSLAALAEGAVVGRRGATAKGMFGAQPFNMLTFAKVDICFQHILWVDRHISANSVLFASEITRCFVLSAGCSYSAIPEMELLQPCCQRFYSHQIF